MISARVIISRLGIAITLGLMLTVCWSCIHRSLEPCVDTTEQTLRIVFTHAPTDAIVDPAELTCGVVYVFDQHDNLEGIWVTRNPRFDVEYDTGITLGPDRYHVVGWINPDPPYTLVPAYDTQDFTGLARSGSSIGLTVPEDGFIVDQLPWLFFGCVTEVYLSPEKPLVEVPMILDSYVINLSVTGLPRNEDDYRLLLSDDNGMYDFDNNYMAFDRFAYAADMRFPPLTRSATRAEGGDRLEASVRTLRLSADRNLEILFTNESQGTSLYPIGDQLNNIIEMILNATPDNSFDQTHLYDINLDFDTDMSVTVTVNGWLVKQSDYVIE